MMSSQAGELKRLASVFAEVLEAAKNLVVSSGCLVLFNPSEILLSHGVNGFDLGTDGFRISHKLVELVKRLALQFAMVDPPTVNDANPLLVALAVVRFRRSWHIDTREKGVNLFARSATIRKNPVKPKVSQGFSSRASEI